MFTRNFRRNQREYMDRMYRKRSGLCKTVAYTGEPMLNFESFQYDDSFFPLYTTSQIFTPEIYEEMKKEWPDFNKFQTMNGNTKGRRNIRIEQNSKNLRILRREAPMYAKLYDYLNSQHFRDKMIELFPDELFQKYGFIKDRYKKGSILMDISKSTDGYENPFHVDTRGRIVHMLVYFGEDLIKEGGEFCIAKHKKLDCWDDYPQIAELEQIEEVKSYPPKDNFGVIVLSTPDSYHKGNTLKGERRFLYISLNENDHKLAAWKSKGWFDNRIGMGKGLKQQQQNNKYKVLQKDLEKHKVL